MPSMLLYKSRLERDKAIEKKLKKHLDRENSPRYDIKVVAQGKSKKLFTKI